MHEESPSAAYPMVRFLVARGKGLAFLLCALVLLAGLGAALASGQLWLLPAGFVASGVLLGLLLSYIEVLRIIADTLIPKY
jgi:hypothetical protein